MKAQNFPRFPLSYRTARTHFDGLGEFSSRRQEGMTVWEMRRAYSFDGAVTGKGVKIAIIAAFDNVAITEDMRVFCQEFGLAVPKMTVYYPLGRAQSTTDNWLLESSLDTQWAHAFAPDSELFVVFAINGNIENLMSCAKYASQTLGADVVSMSFGTGESAGDGRLSEFMSYSESIFVSSSGDEGCSVSFPSSAPCVVSVGGTRLVFNKDRTRVLGEYAYNSGGGGVSEIFEIPEYQKDFYAIASMTRGKRGLPDVSMSACTNPGSTVYCSALGGFTTVGGTSLSCACFAGICACIKQTHPEILTGADMTAFLYNKAGGTAYKVPQYSFRDITVGMSGSCRAFAGWDFATGLGSPVIRSLVT